MKVILKSEFIELGEEGDIIDVNEGYARNYLLPTKKAIPYNNQNAAILASQKNTIQVRREAKRQEYLTLKERIEETELVIKMKAGEKGHLYGAVTSTVIAEHLEKQGIDILKKQIVISSHSIKEIGTHTIGVKLLSGMVATLKLIIEDEDADKKAQQYKTDAEHSAEDVEHAMDQPVEHAVDQPIESSENNEEDSSSRVDEPENVYTNDHTQPDIEQ